MILTFNKGNAAQAPLTERAYGILGLEEDERTARNARQIHKVLTTHPRYQQATYHEPAVRALVARIIKDLNDALAVIEKQSSVQLPAISPLDDPYRTDVNSFLDKVGAYTRVIESGQDEAAIKAAATTLHQFLESDAYKNNVRIFLPQDPIFDFTLLPELPARTLSLPELFDTLRMLQEKAHTLRQSLRTMQS